MTERQDAAIEYQDAFTNWFRKYPENGYQSSLITGRDIAKKTNITESSNR